MSDKRFEMKGPSWSTWDLTSAQWPAVATLLGALHTAGPLYVIITVAGAPDHIHVVGNGTGVWVLKLDQGTTMSVLGAELATVDLMAVQIEYRDEPVEDPAPAVYWLPRQLALGIADAIEMTRVALTDSASLPSTQVELFPSNPQ